MSIWDDLFGKHGHKKNNDVHELLGIIKRMAEEAAMAEQNERRLIKENERLFRELQKCLHKPKPHGARFDVVF